MSEASALSIKNLVKEYVPGKPVLTGISLDIGGADITAIIGPSGTGKSTLIRCINRLVEPTSGAIMFEGRDLVKLPAAELRQARSRIGMVFQEYNLVERLTVMENLLTGCLGKTSAWNEKRGGGLCASCTNASMPSSLPKLANTSSAVVLRCGASSEGAAGSTGTILRSVGPAWRTSRSALASARFDAARDTSSSSSIWLHRPSVTGSTGFRLGAFQ